MTGEDGTDEIGRELLAHELEVGKIVVVRAPGHDIHLSLWVTQVDALTVTLWSGRTHTSVISFVKPDGTIWDDKNRQVHFFEYLGEP